jgi:hypothetical protein
MKQRVKAWYAKELVLDDGIARSNIHLYAPDGHGGFYVLSAALRRSGHSIKRAQWPSGPNCSCYGVMLRGERPAGTLENHGGHCSVPDV